jgi:hypothetical protein
VAEDGRLEISERLTGLKPELLVESAADPPVDIERLRVAAGAVERQHQLRVNALLVWMSSREHLQLAHELGMTTERQLDVEQLDPARKMLLAEPLEVVLRRPLEHDVPERRPAP